MQNARYYVPVFVDESHLTLHTILNISLRGFKLCKLGQLVVGCSTMPLMSARESPEVS